MIMFTSSALSRVSIGVMDPFRTPLLLLSFANSICKQINYYDDIMK